MVAVAHALMLEPSHFVAMMAGAAVTMNLYLVAVGAAAANPALRRLLPDRDLAETPTTAHGAPAAASTGAPSAVTGVGWR